MAIDAEPVVHLLDRIRKRPQMWLAGVGASRPAFLGLVDFLNGIDWQSGGAVLSGLREWLEPQVRVGGPSWDAYILLLIFPGPVLLDAPVREPDPSDEGGPYPIEWLQAYREAWKSIHSDEAAARRALSEAVDLLQTFLRERDAVGEARIRDRHQEYLVQRYQARDAEPEMGQGGGSRWRGRSAE